MQLTPRYDGPPILVLDPPVDDPSVPLLRQRQRFAATLASFGHDEWTAPTRCEGWNASDVLLHLNTTNRFWAASVAAARRGEPTRFLHGFDPVASPAQMVAGARGPSGAEILAEFVASNDALAAAFADLDDAGWQAPGEAPPGHIALRGVALHALWDCWVHERDVVLPQGGAVPEEPDEVAGCLRYGGGLGPAFLAADGSQRTGAYVIEVTDPDLRFVVEIGPSTRVHTGDAPGEALHLSGRAIDVLEALSCRAPLEADVPADDAWMLTGLAAAFDQVPS